MLTEILDCLAQTLRVDPLHLLLARFGFAPPGVRLMILFHRATASYAIDHGDTIFAPQFKAFLKDACAVGHRRPDLADSTIATHRRRLDRELDRLLDLKPTDVEGSHLRATIAVTARDKLLVFLTRRDVEATNNESERALRPSVIFRRVTNGFRSEWGAKAYADLCSVVATGRLAGRTALAVIRDALAAPAPKRTAVQSGG